MDDDNDLTDRYEEICGELEGKTLTDEWNENPDPPPSYGKPDGETIVETVGRTVWVWHVSNTDAEIQFCGESYEVKDER